MDLLMMAFWLKKQFKIIMEKILKIKYGKICDFGTFGGKNNE